MESMMPGGTYVKHTKAGVMQSFLIAVKSADDAIAPAPHGDACCCTLLVIQSAKKDHFKFN
jgi:hypothetical protein